MRGKTATALLMVFLLAGPAMANGQFKSFDFGVKGGINLANISIDPESEVDWENWLRFGGGVTLGFNATPAFGVDLDVLYMMKGAKAEYRSEIGDEGICDVEDHLKLDYIVFKPMMRFTPIEEGATPYLLAGAEVGVLLSADREIEIACEGQSNEGEEDIKDSFTDIDFGLNVGAGLELPAGEMAFVIEAHYALGLSDINDLEDDDTEVKTRGIYGLVGLRF